jgi:hypothetical protein
MIKLQYLDKYIETKLNEESKSKDDAHVSSGKLSASMLGQPVQWQILKVIGVPQKTREEYVIRKFKRGNHVEDWLLEYMEGLVDKQKFVEYKNVVGYVDAVIDMKAWKLDLGVVPHEIKSVSNIKYKRIQRTGADLQHILQAGLYALALGTDKFALDYVATDDYRVETHLFYINEQVTSASEITIEQYINNVIAKYNKAYTSCEVPVFEAFLDWHTKDEYNPYPEFKGLSSEEADVLLEEKYPIAYKKLKGNL